MSGLLPRIEFYTARDGRRLAVRMWNAIEPPRARVVMLHGITSHGGWYNRNSCFLNHCGFEVHLLDRRGSGLNAEDRGDVDRHTTWLDDVAIYLELLRCQAPFSDIGSSAAEESGPKKVPDTLRPVVLCGISWGGKLAAAVARQQPGLIRGLALITPGLYSRFEPGPVQRWALRVPVMQRVQNKRVEIPIQRASLYTETPYWREYVDKDPLSLRDVTYRFAQADSRLTQLARQGAPYIHTPTLLMLAGRDRIVTNARCRAFLGRTGAVHKTLIEYPNAVHTLEFEPEPERYFADLADWIGRTIAT